MRVSQWAILGEINALAHNDVFCDVSRDLLNLKDDGIDPSSQEHFMFQKPFVVNSIFNHVVIMLGDMLPFSFQIYFFNKVS